MFINAVLHARNLEHLLENETSSSLQYNIRYLETFFQYLHLQHLLAISSIISWGDFITSFVYQSVRTFFLDLDPTPYKNLVFQFFWNIRGILDVFVLKAIKIQGLIKKTWMALAIFVERKNRTRFVAGNTATRLFPSSLLQAAGFF